MAANDIPYVQDDAKGPPAIVLNDLIYRPSKGEERFHLGTTAMPFTIREAAWVALLAPIIITAGLILTILTHAVFIVMASIVVDALLGIGIAHLRPLRGESGTTWLALQIKRHRNAVEFWGRQRQVWIGTAIMRQPPPPRVCLRMSTQRVLPQTVDLYGVWHQLEYKGLDDLMADATQRDGRGVHAV